MESMQSLLGVLTEYGPYGLLIFMWWNDMRAIRGAADPARQGDADHDGPVRRRHVRNAADVSEQCGAGENVQQIGRGFERRRDDQYPGVSAAG